MGKSFLATKKHSKIYQDTVGGIKAHTDVMGDEGRKGKTPRRGKICEWNYS